MDKQRGASLERYFLPKYDLGSGLSSEALELSNNAPEEVGGEEGADT